MLQHPEQIVDRCEMETNGVVEEDINDNDIDDDDG